MKKKFNYVLSTFRQFWEYNHGYVKLSILPQVSAIEVTDVCNLKCRFCARDAIMKHRGLGFMSVSEYKLLLSKCRGRIVSPNLSGHGESTLHPDLAEIVALTKLAGAKSVTITTNGTMLEPKLFLSLVEAGMDGFEISFEGTNLEDYEFQRVGASFQVTVFNLLSMAELKQSRSLKVDLGINIIDSQITHPRLSKFKEYWNSQGFRVDVGQLIDWVGLSDQKFFQENYMPETFMHPFSRFKVCPMPWFFCYIQYNGNVVPCCHWLSEPFGNIFKESLAEIWNGQTYRWFRETMVHKGKDSIEYCRKCWDGSLRKDSPYFCEPNPLFPLSRQLLRNVRRFLVWSGQQEYKRG